MPDSDSPATAIAAVINSFTLATLLEKQAQDQLPDNQLNREAYHTEPVWIVS